MVRYPHIAELISTTNVKDANGNDIVTPVSENIVCRVELDSRGKSGDRKGILFMKYKEGNSLVPKNTTVKFNAIEYMIAGVLAYQSHIELWLE